MEENIYDILHLSTDARAPEIQEALDKLDRALKSRQGICAFSPSELEEKKRRIAEIAAITRDYDRMKREKLAITEERSAIFKEYVDHLKPPVRIYKKQLHTWSGSFLLPMAVLEEILASCGIMVLKAPTLPPDFMLPNFTHHLTALNAFKKDEKILAFNASIATVKDYYDLLAYLNKQPYAVIKSKSAAELASLTNQYEKYLVALYGPLHSLRTVFVMMAKVFSNEDSRKAYDNGLLYETLRPLFKQIAKMPYEVKKSAYYAERCIAEIKAIFPSNQLALIIYNKEAGIPLDPYIPE